MIKTEFANEFTHLVYRGEKLIGTIECEEDGWRFYASEPQDQAGRRSWLQWQEALADVKGE